MCIKVQDKTTNIHSNIFQKLNTLIQELLQISNSEESYHCHLNILVVVTNHKYVDGIYIHPKSHVKFEQLAKVP